MSIVEHEATADNANRIMRAVVLGLLVGVLVFLWQSRSATRHGWQEKASPRVAVLGGWQVPGLIWVHGVRAARQIAPGVLVLSVGPGDPPAEKPQPKPEVIEPTAEAKL